MKLLCIVAVVTMLAGMSTADPRPFEHDFDGDDDYSADEYYNDNGPVPDNDLDIATPLESLGAQPSNGDDHSDIQVVDEHEEAADNLFNNILGSTLMNMQAGVRNDPGTGGASGSVTDIQTMSDLYSLLVDQFNSLSTQVQDILAKLVGLTSTVEQDIQDRQTAATPAATTPESTLPAVDAPACIKEDKPSTGPFSLVDSNSQIKVCHPTLGQLCMFRLKRASKDDDLTQAISNKDTTHPLGVSINRHCTDTNTRSHWKWVGQQIDGKRCKWYIQDDGAVVCSRVHATDFSYDTATGQLTVLDGNFAGNCVGINVNTDTVPGGLFVDACSSIESSYGLPVVGWN